MDNETKDNVSFVWHILNGTHDEFLDKFSDAIKLRKQALREQDENVLKIQLTPGTKVRFIPTTKPKYLAGREATVVKINPKKVVVKVNEGEFFEKGAMLGKKINTPLSLIELA